MNKYAVKNLALILLLGITAFSLVRYVQVKGEVRVLTQEKQNLLQELGKEKELREQLALKNTHLKDYLRAGKNRIVRLFRDSSRIQNNLEDVNAKLSILKAENRILIDSRKRIYLENKQFKARLSSVVELRKAMRELITKKRRTPDLEVEGNQGYLLKAGQKTTPAKIKIEVVPAQTKE